jgi:hypothetical protein
MAHKRKKPKKMRPVKKPKRAFEDEDAMDDFDVPDICLGGLSK